MCRPIWSSSVVKIVVLMELLCFHYLMSSLTHVACGSVYVIVYLTVDGSFFFFLCCMCCDTRWLNKLCSLISDVQQDAAV
jgi:hypothetical protein